MADYDLIVIGGGPAGLAAITYALQTQLNGAFGAGVGGKVSSPFALRGLPAVESVWGAQLVHQFAAYVEAKLKNHFWPAVSQITPRAGGRFQVTLAGNVGLGARTLIVCTGAQPQKLYV
jgi:thioredoxin reductase